MKKYIGLLVVCLVLFASCNKNSCSGAVKAKFRDATGLDGCGMLIELNDGETLEPRNLSDFDIDPQDGDKIWVSYHLAENGGTICMVGDVVLIDCIAER